MSGRAKKSTHAKGGKKRQSSKVPVGTHLKEPVGVVGEPSDVSIMSEIPGQSAKSPLCLKGHIFLINFPFQQEYEIAQLGPIYVEWKKSTKRNEKGKLVWVSDQNRLSRDTKIFLATYTKRRKRT